LSRKKYSARLSKGVTTSNVRNVFGLERMIAASAEPLSTDELRKKSVSSILKSLMHSGLKIFSKRRTKGGRTATWVVKR
jgi:hypothetical protein